MGLETVPRTVVLPRKINGFEGDQPTWCVVEQLILIARYLGRSMYDFRHSFLAQSYLKSKNGKRLNGDSWLFYYSETVGEATTLSDTFDQ
jgi:hypothetical protein